MKRIILIAIILVAHSLAAEKALGQNVGIGTTTPTGPLSFGPATNAYGQQMVFYANPNSIPIAGLGTNGNSVLFSMNDDNGNIAFGYGRSNAFNETMRIMGNGNIGIGVKQPTQRLDLANRMRIRWQNALSPGIQMRIVYPDFYNNNAYYNYFIGMFDNNSVGMQSNGTRVFQYWGTTGALTFNLTDGFAGQVLVSNGKDAPPSWQYMTQQDSYNATQEVFDPNSYTITDNDKPAILTGLSVTANVPRRSWMNVDYNIAVNSVSCVTCAPTQFEVEVKLNGTTYNRKELMMVNGRTNTVQVNYMLQMNNGDVLSIAVTKKSGPTLSLPAVAGRLSNVVVWTIPSR
jgi:hypothetical protein